MLRTEAARYARWSAGVALALVAITLSVYLERSWVGYRQNQKAPPPPPPSVERQSGEITFSKVEKDRTIFTVRASRSTEFKGKDENLLEEVQITIFGQSGERHDTIHTTSCQYARGSGKIICSGEVQMDLQSAADAERPPKDATSARLVHVETRGVTFDRMSGIAETDQPVRFTFPSGGGEAVGARYQSDGGILRLKRDVHLTIRQPATASSKAAQTPDKREQEAHVRGAALEFRRETNSLRLLGPVDADFGAVHLTAGELTLLLDASNRAQRLAASAGAGGARPEIRSHGTRGESTVTADSVTAQFAQAGWVQRIEAAGSVRGSLHGQTEEDQLQADRMEMQLLPRVEKPHDLTFEGNVSMQASFASGDSRSLQTAAMRVLFGEEENRASRPVRGETLAAGTIHWTEHAATNGGAATHMELSANHLALDFGAGGRAERLEAQGNVQTQRQIPGKALQTATSQSATAQLAASGGWTQMDLHGDVRLKEGDRNAQAEQAIFHRAEQTAVLTGNARVRDPATETQARQITFMQTTGDIHAEGGVRSTDLSPHSSAIHLAPQSANVTADKLQANSQTGRALYTGHARLWQGDSVLEADAIELLRSPRGLNANGNVRAVFPQTALAVKTPAGASPVQAAAKQAARSSNLWHVQSESLTYREADNRAHLEKNVFAACDTERIRAAALDLYFMRSQINGAQQLSRALGTGGVTVEQGDRRGVAERGEYLASAGKFVLSGGTPTLYDALRGTTTGRQLTFFLADDTIIVDSENGSRTLTRHRVEK